MNDRELLERLARVLVPVDGLIDHSLWVGTEEQMRADLSYLRGLFSAALGAIQEQLA